MIEGECPHCGEPVRELESRHPFDGVFDGGSVKKITHEGNPAVATGVGVISPSEMEEIHSRGYVVDEVIPNERNIHGHGSLVVFRERRK